MTGEDPATGYRVTVKVDGDITDNRHPDGWSHLSYLLPGIINRHLDHMLELDMLSPPGPAVEVRVTDERTGDTLILLQLAAHP